MLYPEDHHCIVNIICFCPVSADANRAPLFHSEAFYKQNDQILPFLLLLSPWRVGLVFLESGLFGWGVLLETLYVYANLQQATKNENLSSTENV